MQLFHVAALGLRIIKTVGACPAILNPVRRVEGANEKPVFSLGKRVSENHFRWVRLIGLRLIERRLPLPMRGMPVVLISQTSGFPS